MSDNSTQLSSSSSSRNDPQLNGNEQLIAAASTNGGRGGMERDVYMAAEKGKVEKLRWLNWKHQKTPTGNNVLHVHVGKRLETVKGNLTENVNLHFIRYVLHETADDLMLLEMNDKGDTPLHLAVRCGHIDAVQEFLKRHEVVGVLNKVNNDMDTVLHDAARVGHAKIIRILIEQASELALELDHMPNKFGETPLFLAAERGYTKSFGAIVRITDLAALAHRGPCGQTALHAAVLYENKDIVEQILEIDTSGSLIRIKNDRGQTPLHCCAARNIKKEHTIFRALLNHDDQCNSAAYLQDNEGQTALHIATLNFNYKAVKMLIRSYPDCTEIVDNKGQNVVHLAANSGRLHTFEWFLKKAPKCDRLVNERDKNGNTPLHVFAASTPSIFICDWRYKLPTFIKRYYELDIKAFNNDNLTAGDIFACNDKFHHVTNCTKLSKTLPWGRRTNNGDERTQHVERQETVNNRQENVSIVKGEEERVSHLRKAGETRLVVAALIVTVSFAAGFTVPGGLNQTPGDNIGMAVLTKTNAFTQFIIHDTLAFMLSSLAVMCYFTIAGEKDAAKVIRLSMTAEFLSSISLGFLMMAFQTGVTAVVSSSLSFVTNIIFFISLIWYSVLFRRSYREEWDKWSREFRNCPV
ncbi:hypothetical protein KSS87_008354 [Heliosperma pusillum]|nr:hypothetical protein KSS87_008354 [Heliosperma pusillum]